MTQVCINAPFCLQIHFNFLLSSHGVAAQIVGDSHIGHSGLGGGLAAPCSGMGVLVFDGPAPLNVSRADRSSSLLRLPAKLDAARFRVGALGGFYPRLGMRPNENGLAGPCSSWEVLSRSVDLFIIALKDC